MEHAKKLEFDPKASLYEQWSELANKFDNDYRIHLYAMSKQFEIIKQSIYGYSDDRLLVAAAALSAGEGQKAAVMMEADWGTGKTTFGKLAFGFENITQIDKETTANTLRGYVSPIGIGTVVEGTLKGLDDPNKKHMFLNEATVLGSNPDTINALFEGPTIKLNGKTVNIDGSSILLTGNFPDGRRVKEVDRSLRSRTGAWLLMGDIDEEGAIARNIAIARKANEGQEGGVMPFSPIIPAYNIRQSLKEHVKNRHPLDAEAVGRYVTSLYSALNSSGLTREISLSDARKVEAMYTMARAFKLVNDVKSATNNPQSIVANPEVSQESRITPLDIAYIAALVLPSEVKFKDSLYEDLVVAVGKEPNHTEMGVMLRRCLARTAIGVYLDRVVGQAAPDDEEALRTQFNQSKKKAAMIDKATFANIKAVNFNVDDALDQLQSKQAERHS